MEHFYRHDMLDDSKINAEIDGERATHHDYVTLFRMSETKNMLSVSLPLAEQYIADETKTRQSGSIPKFLVPPRLVQCLQEENVWPITRIADTGLNAHIGHNQELAFWARRERLRTTAQLLTVSRQTDFIWIARTKCYSGGKRTFSMYNAKWQIYPRAGRWAEPDTQCSGSVKLHLSDGLWYIACTSEDGELYVITPEENQELFVGAVDELRLEYPTNDAYVYRLSFGLRHTETPIDCKPSFPSLQSSSTYESPSRLPPVLTTF
jgi:hypothetical protein